mmetsp:Transcript_37804/g.100038  ORF Transcript_37804/g.100038 Transcript_37804/m.100038 type:complete len:104 (+) Transcript_37804:312-623(+)
MKACMRQKKDCFGNESKVEKCVGCITSTSLTCWENPLSIGGCILGPCRADAVIKDPLACPACWINYVDGCLGKYAGCFNTTVSAPALAPTWESLDEIEHDITV